jgi:hypothetical protein
MTTNNNPVGISNCVRFRRYDILFWSLEKRLDFTDKSIFFLKQFLILTELWIEIDYSRVKIRLDNLSSGRFLKVDGPSYTHFYFSLNFIYTLENTYYCDTINKVFKGTISIYSSGDSF